MTSRELYEKLGRTLGLTEETEVVEAARKGTGEALGRLVSELLAAKSPLDLYRIAGGMRKEGTRLGDSLANVIGIKQAAADEAAIRSFGFDPCPTCGEIGEHICKALRVEADVPTP